jgi:hypothetical protein
MSERGEGHVSEQEQTLPQVDCRRWITRWDALQTAYLPYREERFTIMRDVVEQVIGESFVARDLACGPGAISPRLLARFPQARCVAVDYDPALPARGRGALGDTDGRLRWVEADLREPRWIERLGETRIDAVFSTTALHWLDAGPLTRLYTQPGTLVRSGGVALNGDHMAFPPHPPTFRALADSSIERRRAQAVTHGGAEDWRAWWGAFTCEPGIEPLVVERGRRFASVAERRHGTNALDQAGNDATNDAAGETTNPVDRAAPIGDVHEAALRDAGLGEVGLIWRTLDDGILLAVR